MVTILTSRARALFLLGCLLAAGCGDEGPSGPAARAIVPESWQGTWRILYTEYSCIDSSLVDGPYPEVRYACPGQTLEEFLGIQYEGLTLNCAGEFGDNDLTAHCTGELILFCDIALSGDLQASRLDSLFTGSISLLATYLCDDETECFYFTLDGERIGPAACDSAAVQAPILTRFLRGPRWGS